MPKACGKCKRRNWDAEASGDEVLKNFSKKPEELVPGFDGAVDSLLRAKPLPRKSINVGGNVGFDGEAPQQRSVYDRPEFRGPIPKGGKKKG